MAGARAGYSALKRLGEMLMRGAETEPRLARAAAQGYDLLNPVVHGTNNAQIAEQVPRAFYVTSQPAHAMQYTGGGRRAGSGTQSKGGVLIPTVLKGTPLDTGLSVDTAVSMTDFDWLRKLGIDNPEAFRKKVWERNIARQMAMPYTQGFLDSGRTFDNALGNSMGIAGRPSPPLRLHEALGAMTADLAEDSPLIKFSHTYYDTTISPKGRVMRSKEVMPGDAILVADPSLARSPWAAFEDDAVGQAGLMKAKGGLVQYKECSC